MYDLSNSVQNLFDDGIEKRGFYLFCPDVFVSFLTDDQRRLSLEELKRQVRMPWGSPYLSEVVVNAANLVLRMEADETLEYRPLWDEQRAANWIPSAGSGKDSCFLVCRTADSVSHDTVKPAVLVCPGGGYEAVDTVNEGFRTAAALEARGYRVFMLRYRTAPNSYPEPQKDLALAIKTIRANADQWRLDPDDFLVAGFSAGGHLVASETLYSQEIDAILTCELEEKHPVLAKRYAGISPKADKVSLSYPVISMTSETHAGSVQALTHGDPALMDKLSVELHADAAFPKTFIWANDDDPEVPPSNAKRLAQRLDSEGVPVMYRTYPEGGHGCGLGTGTSCEGWIDEMTAWMNG